MQSEGIAPFPDRCLLVPFHVIFVSDPLRVIVSLYLRTFISLYRLLEKYQGDNIYKQIENLHTVCV